MIGKPPQRYCGKRKKSDFGTQSSVNKSLIRLMNEVFDNWLKKKKDFISPESETG